ncbi:MAG: SDR family NAD(P)-dependent oxidoreductase, partial [Thermoplasmatota archaeon]
MNLQGKKALVSGGSKGIGKAIARSLLEASAEVLIFSRHEEDLEKVREELGPDRLHIVEVDQSEDLSPVEKKVKDLWGHLDILVNNTSVSAGSVKHADIRKGVDVNVTGYIKLTQLMLPYMKGGHIINIGS